jgi:hypothetical protein
VDSILEVIAIPTSLYGANINWDQAIEMDWNLFSKVRERIGVIREHEIKEAKKTR